MKAWTIRDQKGRLPIEKEMEQFKRWFMRVDSAPRIKTAFSVGDDGKTAIGIED